jgi:hypothetical protein
MTDAESDNIVGDGPVPGELFKEASITTNEEDAELVYDHSHFRRDKVRRQYFRYYHGRKIIIKKGAAIEEFDECAPSVWAMLDAQGWTDVA